MKKNWCPYLVKSKQGSIPQGDEVMRLDIQKKGKRVWKKWERGKKCKRKWGV